ncbi:DUF2442 domain-containing protein [Thermophilibacter provencensis]|uniref:DUF2442 domain-containing protein n=1 Tax=Thermophilibacter provencensis TaxID=1852386 RepID=UPI0009F836B4|nr:DUF2442 domain-containing protein [Thermophilibacter provencensis]
MRVVAAKVVNDLPMLVTFSTGETRLFDASPLLEMPVFAPLRSNEVFSGFAIDHGAVSWAGGDIDLAPETMYKMSYAYERIA